MWRSDFFLKLPSLSSSLSHRSSYLLYSACDYYFWLSTPIWKLLKKCSEGQWPQNVPGSLVSLPHNPPVPLPLLSSTPGTSCPVETQHPESQTPPLCLTASLSRGCKDNNSTFFEVSGQDFVIWEWGRVRAAHKHAFKHSSWGKTGSSRAHE